MIKPHRVTEDGQNNKAIACWLLNALLCAQCFFLCLLFLRLVAFLVERPYGFCLHQFFRCICVCSRNDLKFHFKNFYI